jgi:multidrug resistance protein MdtO
VPSAARLYLKPQFAQWFPQFLRQELAPYPGRSAVVTRMVIAATLSMIIIVTFRIPYGAIGVNCAFILSRENLVSTAKSGFYFAFAFALWALLTPIGARMFASVPSTHFLWEFISIFICFFLLRTLTNFPLATGIVVVATGTLTIWYLPGPAESNLELTLWQILATCIGAVITVLVEVVFRYYDRSDPLREGITDRLRNIEDMLRAYSEGQAVPDTVSQALTRYAVTGSGVLRRQVARNNYTPLQRMKMSALVSLTARSIDLATAYASSTGVLEISMRQRAALLLSRVVDIQRAVKTGDLPREWQMVQIPAESALLFSELEYMIGLMVSVLRTNSPIDPRLTVLEPPESPHRILVQDAFSNPDHLKFALIGTSAAMLCYIVYVALDWPGISTAVTTCILTALSTIGSSRQKQMLRIAGAMIGGFVFGLGSQIFILPYIDSITGLTAVFACVTAVSAYVATSSTRLSYAGLQMAFAFYLINVTDFSISLDLTIGRDRAVGVLLGITMMWIVFERLKPASAAEQMVRTFARSARLIAAILSGSFIGDGGKGVIWIRQQRDQLSRLFDEVHAEADAVLFETGKQRPGHMAARDRVRRWQAALRTFYLMELPLMQMRLYGDRTLVSSSLLPLEKRFRECCSESLIQMADRLENEINNDSCSRQPDQNRSDALLTDLATQGHTEMSSQEMSMLGLMSQLVRMIDKLESEVLDTSVFATE